MGHQRKCRMISSSVAQAALFAPFRSSGTPPSRQPADVAPNHLWPLQKSPSSRAARSWGLIQLAGGPRQLDQTSPKGMRT